MMSEQVAGIFELPDTYSTFNLGVAVFIKHVAHVLGKNSCKRGVIEPLP
jgi:hypothetical protein